MFWAIWAAVGPVSREKKRVSFLGIVVAKEDRRQPQGGLGGPGPGSGCWNSAAGEVRELSPGL